MAGSFSYNEGLIGSTKPAGSDPYNKGKVGSTGSAGYDAYNRGRIGGSELDPGSKPAALHTEFAEGDSASDRAYGTQDVIFYIQKAGGGGGGDGDTFEDVYGGFSKETSGSDFGSVSPEFGGDYTYILTKVIGIRFRQVVQMEQLVGKLHLDKLQLNQLHHLFFQTKALCLGH